MDKMGKTLSKIITYLLVVLLCMGIAGGIITLIQKLTEDKGLYIEYNGEQYFSSDEMTITCEEFNYVNLSLSNTEDWGDYTITDYTVRIVPYNTDDYDFYYKVNDTRYTFSSTSDLSAGFTCDYTDYDGNGLQVSNDGTISFYINNIVNTSGTCNMKSFLTYVWYHSFTSSFDRVALLTSNPDFTEDFCFAIRVYSPDNEIALEIPFRLDITDVAVDDDNEEDSSGSDSGEDSSSDSSNLDDDNDDEDVDISYSILTYEAYSGSNDYTLIYDGPTTAFAEETVSFSLSVSTLVYVSDVIVYDVSGNEVALNDTSDYIYEFIMPYSDVYIYIYIEDVETEEDSDPSITYTLYNVTAQCDLPSTIEEITDDTLTLTFAVNDGYHISDCTSDSSDSSIYVSSDGGVMVGGVFVADNDSYSICVADDIVTIVITAADLTSGFSIEIGAEKTHYIYLDMTGCNLYYYHHIGNDDYTQLIPYDYMSRDGLYLEYYYSYGRVELCFSSEDGYSFWYYVDEDYTEINYDNYSYSITYSGDITYVVCSHEGYLGYGVWFVLNNSFGLYSTVDWSITIHLTCFEEIEYSWE